MKKINYEEIRKNWIKSTEGEIKYRIHHIEARKQEIINLYKQNRVPLLEESELLYNIFTFLNWLAHIDLGNSKYIEEKKMLTWLQKIIIWPQFAVEAFWLCLRNPNMHMGRTSMFSEHNRTTTIEKSTESWLLKIIRMIFPYLYKKIREKNLFINKKYKLFAGFMLNLNFDPKSFQPNKYKPSEIEDGYIASIDPFNSKKLEVMFYYAGVRRKLSVVSNNVLKNIQESDEAFLNKLVKVNKTILPFYYVD